MKNYSWKTTAIAISAIISTVYSLILQPLTDGVATTNPDWNVAIPLIIGQCVGLFTRDDTVSSKMLGIEK